MFDTRIIMLQKIQFTINVICLTAMATYSVFPRLLQVWHYCKTDGIKESFLCPNGTIYNQVNRVCEWWFNVQCEDTSAAYRVCGAGVAIGLMTGLLENGEELYFVIFLFSGILCIIYLSYLEEFRSLVSYI